MSHVNAAISPARRPAFADSKTITRLRRGLRVVLAKWRRWFNSSEESVFACLPAIMTSLQKYICDSIRYFKHQRHCLLIRKEHKAYQFAQCWFGTQARFGK